ncbi:MAG: hypothetical protein AAB652_01145 [Patescibacteria group bacterium]
MKASKAIIFAGLIILLLAALYFAMQYKTAESDLRTLQANFEAQKTNENVIIFLRAFIEKVLKAEKEVDFETRLNLENQVRALKDPTILAQWERFTGSKTEAEAQSNVKELLELLASKIEVK